MNGQLIDIKESKLWEECRVFFQSSAITLQYENLLPFSSFSGIAKKKKKICSVYYIAIYILALDFQEDEKTVSISTKTKERLSP